MILGWLAISGSGASVRFEPSVEALVTVVGLLVAGETVGAGCALLVAIEFVAVAIEDWATLRRPGLSCAWVEKAHRHMAVKKTKAICISLIVKEGCGDARNAM